MKHILRLPLVSACLTALALILSACGLSSEPPIVRTAPLPTITNTAPPDLGKPPARVNLMNGAAVFAGGQSCAQCHGVAGAWDGPVAASFACQPRLNDPDNRGKTVLAWFGITTNGNNGAPACLMPPWRTRLTEQQRWDAVSYAYSLHYTPEQLARGRELWAGECAACHGDRGAGDGPRAAELSRPAPDFTDPGYLISKSDTELWGRITNGIEGIPDHAFPDLSAEDRYAVIAFMRAQTWDGIEVITQGNTPIETEEAADAGAAATGVPTGAATVAPNAGTPGAVTPTGAATGTAVAVGPLPPAPGDTLTVRGTVTSGTPDLPIPAGQAITLRILERTDQGPRDVQRLETTAGADGQYTFANVPRRPGFIYVPLTTFDDILQFGDPVELPENAEPTLNLPLTVFGVSSDPSIIRVEIQRLFVDYLSSDRVLIQEAMRFRNIGDRIYVQEERISTGDRLTLQFDLPAGAENANLSADSASQFVLRGSSVLSLIPVTPGSAPTLQLSYELPLSGGQLALGLRNRYRVDALLVNVPQANGARVEDPRWAEAEPVTLSNGVYSTYALREPLGAGAGITITVRGNVGAGGGDNAIVLLVVVVTLLILSGTVGAIWLLNRRDQTPQTAAPEQTAEDLVAAIAALDEVYAESGGTMSAEAYQAQRNALKAKLAALIARAADTPDGEGTESKAE